jgi:hypothetical protein
MTLHQYTIQQKDPLGILSRRTFTSPVDSQDKAYQKGIICNYHFYKVAVFKIKPKA